MDDVLIRALAIDAEAALRLGGLELATADRASKQLIEKCPFRESALALRMDVLEALGNTAEALLTYDELRTRLSDELGAGPGPELQARHERPLLMTGLGRSPSSGHDHALVTSAPMEGRSTVHADIGDVFAYACAAGLVLMAGWAVRAALRPRRASVRQPAS